MNKYLLGLIIILAFVSCKKDEVNTQKDYSYILNQTTPTFQGNFDGERFSWRFGWNQFQSIAGYENGDGLCDSTDPSRVLMFGLTSEDGGKTRFLLYTPKYNSASDTEISQLFSVGKKTLGDLRRDFYLTISKNNQFYQSSRSSTSNEIEILKTEKFWDYSVQKLRVWFHIEAKLSSCGCGVDNSSITDGLMIVEFYGVKKGQ